VAFGARARTRFLKQQTRLVRVSNRQKFVMHKSVETLVVSNYHHFCKFTKLQYYYYCRIKLHKPMFLFCFDRWTLRILKLLPIREPENVQIEVTFHGFDQFNWLRC